MVWGLIAEDDAADAMMITQAFKIVDGSLNLKIERTGEAALTRLDAAAQARDMPAFALFDIRLPGASGVQSVRALKARHALRSLHAAIYSGSTMEQDRADALAAGADYFFVKPMDFDELIAACQWICDSWVQMARTR